MELKQIKEHIEAMKEGDEFVWPESDYGKAEIWRKNEVFIVFSIPTFGGIPAFEKALKRADDVINLVQSWT